jgi:hypothetical protein
MKGLPLYYHLSSDKKIDQPPVFVIERDESHLPILIPLEADGGCCR